MKGQGVLFAPQLRRFTCVTGQVAAVQARASLPELAALLQVRGAVWAWLKECALSALD